jgi:cation-transporting ATPase E
VRNGSVFGRVPPSLKARLVAALRREGEWVAMVGDGVNDILSLKQAHLGIAMQSGSQATRAVADIVLLDDSFSALPEAVIEGQRIVAGMTDSMALFLTRVLYMALAILVTAIAGLPIPVDPKHNTVVALLTVGIPALALAYWARPSRSGFDAVRRILALVVPPAVVLAALGLPLYWWASSTMVLAEARTTFTTFAVMCGLLLLPLLHPPVAVSFTSADPVERPHADPRPTMLALAMLGLYVLCFVVQPASDFFELVPLGVGVFALTAVVAAAWAVITVVLWRAEVYQRGQALVAGWRGRKVAQPAD